MADIMTKNRTAFREFARFAAMRDISSQTAEEIWKAGKLKRFEKGDLILRAMEKSQGICFLLSGKVIQYNLTHSGKRKILFIFGPGNLLNDHVFDDHNSTIYCEAIEDARVLLLSKDDFNRIMEGDFSLIRAVMSEQERKMWRLSHQLKNTVSSIYLERKLAAKLWKLARDFGISRDDGIEIDVTMSITFLADMLGVPRETASRVFRVLADQKLVRQERKRVIVIDPDRLAHFYKIGEIP
ncbi:MAG: Crp/Fnr family transcriptional regulator [Eubacterium sp.]|nr:Crp/Fnr family transcriptional regulator [Eubacterium sp.]